MIYRSPAKQCSLAKGYSVTRITRRLLFSFLILLFTNLQLQRVEPKEVMMYLLPYCKPVRGISPKNVASS